VFHRLVCVRTGRLNECPDTDTGADCRADSSAWLDDHCGILAKHCDCRYWSCVGRVQIFTLRPAHRGPGRYVPSVAGITVRFTSHDYAYTVVVANTGGAATRVRGVLLELRNGSIMAATSLESPQPDASGSYNLPSHDQLRWSYGLDLFRNAGSPERDPPTVDVRPVVEWGAGRTLIGSWRTVRLDGQPLRFGGGEETLEIGSPPAQGGQIEDASP
jgi:hypothetical protein